MYWTGGRGFRVLVQHRSMFVCVPGALYRQQRNMRMNVRAFAKFHAVPALLRALCPKGFNIPCLSAMLDESVFGLRAGVKTDFYAHPGTGFYPAQLDADTLAKGNWAPLVILRPDEPDCALRCALRTFWQFWADIFASSLIDIVTVTAADIAAVAPARATASGPTAVAGTVAQRMPVPEYLAHCMNVLAQLLV